MCSVTLLAPILCSIFSRCIVALYSTTLFDVENKSQKVCFWLLPSELCIFIPILDLALQLELETSTNHGESFWVWINFTIKLVIAWPLIVVVGEKLISNLFNSIAIWQVFPKGQLVCNNLNFNMVGMVNYPSKLKRLGFEDIWEFWWIDYVVVWEIWNFKWGMVKLMFGPFWFYNIFAYFFIFLHIS